MNALNLSSFGSSISTRLAQWSVGIAVFLGLVLSLVQISFDFFRQTQALNDNISVILKVASDPARQAVYNLDPEVAEDVVKGLHRYRFIVSAEILDETEQSMGRLEKAGDQASFSQVLGWVIPQYKIHTLDLAWYESGELLGEGELIVRVDQHIALSDYLDRSLFVIGSGVIRNLLLALILIWLFRKLLGTPLRLITEKLQKMDPLQPGINRIEVQHQHQDDELGVLMANINRYADANDQFIRLRFEAETKLIETEQRFRHLYENSVAAMATTTSGSDCFQSIRSCNQAFADLFGYSDPDDVYQNFHAELHWQDSAQYLAYYRQLGQQREILNQDINYCRRNGETFWASVSERMIPGQNEGDSVIIDISHLKRAETELKEQRENLENIVQLRTRELQRIVEEQKSFNYAVSHDLRAPLRAINGFSDALLEDYSASLDGTARDYLKRVCNASNRMSELIESLLTLSRISHREMDVAALSIDQLAEDVMNDLKEYDDLDSINLHIQPDMNGNADKGLLKIVLTNLFSNAMKFTSDREQALIEFGEYRERGESIFFVKDNGIGFDETYADKLFEAFRRLHEADKFEGIGIGLATVKRIIERHGGRVWARSKTGQGAVFYFTLQD